MNAELMTVIERITEQLGLGAGRVFEAYIFQARIQAVTMFVAFAILSAGMIWFALAMRRNAVKDGKWDDNRGSLGLLQIIFGFSALVYLVTSAMILSDGFAALVNPEYWAIKELLGGAIR